MGKSNKLILSKKRVNLLLSIEGRMRSKLENLIDIMNCDRVSELCSDIVQESCSEYKTYIRGYKVLNVYMKRIEGFSSGLDIFDDRWDTEMDISEDDFVEGIHIIRGYLAYLSLSTFFESNKLELLEEINFLELLKQKRLG